MNSCYREADFVIDALDLRALLPQLGQFFANPAIVKVFHGSDHDLMWLQRDFSLYVVSMFDTFDAATSLGLYTRSFAHLVHHYCQVIRLLCRPFLLAVESSKCGYPVCR